MIIDYQAAARRQKETQGAGPYTPYDFVYGEIMKAIQPLLNGKITYSQFSLLIRACLLFQKYYTEPTADEIEHLKLRDAEPEQSKRIVCLSRISELQDAMEAAER